MAALPLYVVVRKSGFAEDFDPSVQRDEMERGIPKQRVINSRVLMKLSVSLLFRTSEDAESFNDWYFDVIKRIGQFTMTHPRTGETITAGFEGGRIGRLQSIASNDSLWQRDVVVEYLR